MLLDDTELTRLLSRARSVAFSSRGNVRGSFNLSGEERYNQSGSRISWSSAPTTRRPFLVRAIGWAGTGFALAPPAVLYPMRGHGGGSIKPIWSA